MSAGYIVVNKVKVLIGNTGYQHQLDRARRFFDKVRSDYQGLDNIDEVEFQDMMWSFLQHCWHIKEWIENDPLVLPLQKKAAIGMAHRSPTLRICQDLCNGTKHLKLTKPRSGTGASHAFVDINIVPGEGRFEIDCIFDDGQGTSISGKLLAQNCIAEWERILASQGLATDRLS